MCVCVCHRFSRIVGFWVSIVFSHSTHKGLDHAPPQACDETIDASVCVSVCLHMEKKDSPPQRRLLREREDFIRSIQKLYQIFEGQYSRSI